jgi:hypothetical protein
MRLKLQIIGYYYEATKMNDTSICLLDLSLTDKVNQMALYNGKTKELPDSDAAKVCINLFKPFHAKNINKMNELRVRSKRALFILQKLILMNGLQTYTSYVGV